MHQWAKIRDIFGGGPSDTHLKFLMGALSIVSKLIGGNTPLRKFYGGNVPIDGRGQIKFSLRLRCCKNSPIHPKIHFYCIFKRQFLLDG